MLFTLDGAWIRATAFCRGHSYGEAVHLVGARECFFYPRLAVQNGLASLQKLIVVWAGLVHDPQLDRAAEVAVALLGRARLDL